MPGMIDLKQMINEALKKSKKLKEVYIKIHWEDVVGKLSEKSFPENLKNETLNVICESSAIVHHMSLHKEEYMKKTNEIIKESFVKEIRFKIGALDKTEKNFFGGKNE